MGIRRRDFLKITGYFLGGALASLSHDFYIKEAQAFFKLISTEKEIQLGKLYTPSSIDEFEGIYPEEETQNYIKILGEKLARQSIRQMPYQFYLVNSGIVNAFALPGGPVVITRGLFLTLENEDELAGILGHEIGHIERRHHASFIEKQFALSIILQIGSLLLPQNLTGEALFQLGRISAGLLSLKFSRDQEREADESALNIILKAGYSPEGMLKVFERFKKMEKSRPPEWLSTHPLPDSRIKEWQEKLEIIKPSGAYIKNTPSFDKIKNKLIETQSSFKELEKGKAAFKERDFEKAKSHLNRALEIYPKNVPAYLYLSRIYLRENNPSLAKEQAFRALKYNPELYSAHYLCGLSEFNLQNWERAIAYFEKTKKLIPFEGATYYYAGRSYEQVGNFPAAKENYKKALELGPKNAPWYQDCYQRYLRLK
ncbi:MAG: M48 family metalloprotease [Caldimicrobium sp.]